MKSRISILVTLGFLMLLVVGWTIYGQQKSSTRPAWEYRYENNLTAEQVNTLGADGWEMVGFSVDEAYNKHCYFKRAKNP